MPRLLSAVLLTLFLSLAGCADTECEWGDYGAWDGDGDALLSQSEFYGGFENAGGFDHWDVDGSGVLNENEFETVFGDLGGDFSDWDQNDDDQLRANEVYSGLFNQWDDDGDGAIGCSEFDEEWAQQYGVAAA